MQIFTPHTTLARSTNHAVRRHGRPAAESLPALVVLLMSGMVACSGGSRSAGAPSDTSGIATTTPAGSTATASAGGTTGTALATLPTAITDVGTHGEDLYDEVSAANWTKAQAIMDSLDRSVKALPANESRIQTERTQLTGVLDTVHRAIAAHQRATALEGANQVTYLSAKMTAPYSPPTPAEVLLLDYYGRELAIWSAQKNQAKLMQTATDLQHTWTTLRPTVQSHGGTAAAQHTDSLVTRIAAAKSPAEYARLATPFLDEVDELEKVFTRQ